MTTPLRKPRLVNAEILDRIIAHAIDLEHFKNYEVRQIVAFLNSHVEPDLVRQLQQYAGRELTLQRLKALRLAIKEILVAGYAQLRQAVTADLWELGGVESQWNQAMLTRVTPVAVSFAAPSVAAIRAMLRTRPVNGRFLKEWLSDLAPATLARVNQQIMIGAVAGEGIDQIVRRIAGTRVNQYRDGILQRSRRNIEAVVRTAVAGVSNNVRQLTYETNRKVVKSVQFVATLDLRTCEACAALDGAIYEIDDGPRPPIHPSCRCTTSPVLRSWKDLGLDLKEAPASARASMNGQVPGTVRFPDWFAQRNAGEQDQVLGKTRGLLYRAGKLQMRDFVDARDPSRILTLRELEKRL
jgi:SPP1 gp7 family putative phage head morphogenesis protein